MNIYSAVEQNAMRWFQCKKDALLSPVVQGLLSLGVTANMVSALSAMAAVGGLFATLATAQPWFIIVGLWAHILLDGLDGSLARAGTPSGDAGVAADLWADSIGVLCLGLYLTISDLATTAMGALFTVAYLGLNAISFALARRGAQFRFVLRPRILILGGITVDMTFSSAVTPLIVPFANAALGAFVGLGLYTLTRRQ